VGSSLTLMLLGLAVGTWLLRFVPMAALQRVRLPGWAEEWLRLVPGAVLAASLAQILFLAHDRLAISWRNPYLLAALPASLVAWRTRNVPTTMVVGIAAYALCQALL
jgi:branched-subunit amino acid transport protein